MDFIYNKIFLEHDTGLHPENKKRLIEFQDLANIKETEIPKTDSHLKLFHDKKYIENVKKICKFSGMLDLDTQTSPHTYKAAIAAVNATIMASKKGDFALCRPPGHHAYPKKASGFCIFNNISIAVENLVQDNEKVLIFDFDSHLGDGTEKFFLDREDVLYISIHQFPAFPGFGSVDEIGEKKGKGFTINVALPPKSADDVYLDALERLKPILKQYNPSIIASSAGFDGHKDDPLLDLNLSAQSFYETGKFLSNNCKKVFATLEGGYNLKTLPRLIYGFRDGINNAKQHFPEEKTDSSKTVIKEYHKRINKLDKNLTKYWDL